MEIWKDIEDYEGLYQVSNYGRVRSLDRFVKHNYGEFKIVRGSIKKLYVDKRSYNSITTNLYKENKCKKHIVARLVATAFIANSKSLSLVEHIDNDPTNNHVSNLKWGTPKTNAQAREIIMKRKLTKKDKDKIKNSELNGPELSKMYNVSKGYIYNIKKGIR